MSRIVVGGMKAALCLFLVVAQLACTARYTRQGPMDARDVARAIDVGDSVEILTTDRRTVFMTVTRITTLRVIGSNGGQMHEVAVADIARIRYTAVSGGKTLLAIAAVLAVLTLAARVVVEGMIESITGDDDD